MQIIKCAKCGKTLFEMEASTATLKKKCPDNKCRAMNLIVFTDSNLEQIIIK